MNKNIMKLFLGLLTFVLVLSSCYKEDTQILYSRQYVIPSLTAWRDSVNNRLDELQEGLNKIVNQELVSDLAYVVSGGDTVGVNITLGTKTVFVPYGKNGKDGLNGKDGKDGKDGAAGADGKDGQSYEVTMGENGNWFINGQDTGKPWRGLKGDKGDTGADGTDGTNGEDGLTPTFGIKQDTDGNFYWTIAWPGTAETYILSNGNKVRANGWDGATGAQGPQGPAGPQGPQGEQGIQGTPGVDSPLREVSETDTTYVFRLEYPDGTITTYTIPKAKEVKIPEETPLTVAIADKTGDKATSVVTFTTDPGATVSYQIDGGEIQTGTAGTDGVLTVEVPKTFDGPLLVSGWARNTKDGKYSSPTKSMKVPVKQLEWPAVKITNMLKYEINPGFNRETGSLWVFEPTAAQMAEYDFQLRNGENQNAPGATVTQTFNATEGAKRAAGAIGGTAANSFYVANTTFYSSRSSAELWISLKGKDQYIKVGTYSQTVTGLWTYVITPKFEYDPAYPGKP